MTSLISRNIFMLYVDSKGPWRYIFCRLIEKNFEVIVILVVKFYVGSLVSELLKANDTNRLPSCFINRLILMTSEQGKLYKIIVN